MKCPRCQHENRLAAKFCDECGMPFDVPSETHPSSPRTELERALSEALDQQAAAAEILGIISNSPTDAQRVFDAIAVNALRLCDARGAVVVRYDGALLHVVAHHNVNPEAVDRMKQRFPLVPDRRLPIGRAVLDAAVVQVTDLQTVEFSGMVAREFGARGHVAIPLLHMGRAIGAIGISRPTLGPFSDRQIALLQTFAEQAVIAIENVRLFTELEARNRDLTATGEILRVIASSPTDVQPVFDTVAKSAARLCEANDAEIFRRDGDRLLLVAHHGPIPSRTLAVPLVRETFNGRTVLDGRTFHVADLQSKTDEFPRGSELARQHGTRAQLSVPLMREGVAIGTISLRRTEARLFTERQVALLQTFADQAVIAIENVRLFKELQEKNEALTQAHAQVTDALEQQTATSEILRVIASSPSSSPTDVQPVLDTIARNAVRLCDSTDALVALVDGGETVTRAHYGDQVFLPSNRLPLARGFVVGRAVLEARPIQVDDLTTTDDFPEGRELALRMGHRTVMAVPMLRDGVAIGAILMRRSRLKPFTDTQIALLQTFADQAVIAIENVRLFNETKEALERETATGEILRVISSSPTDIQPVLDAVAESAARLCDTNDVAIFRRDGDRLVLVAHYGPVPEGSIGEFAIPLIRGTASGRAVLDGCTVHIADMQAETDEFPEGSAFAQQLGQRTVLSVPLMREGVAIGTIALRRTEAQLFNDRQVTLLTTFADQAVIAIENVRLFTELQEKNRALTQAHAQVTEALDQQTATSEILRVIASSPTDVQPVFDTIVRSAVLLCGGMHGTAVRFDGESMHLAAGYNYTPEVAQALHKAFPMRPSPLMMSGRAILSGGVVQVEDAFEDPDYSQEVARAGGFRSMLSAPMLRDGRPIGAIVVNRGWPGRFSPTQIGLLQTFADQAVIAIENARLFSELQQKNEALTQAHAQVTESLDQQTATSEILRVISRSQTDVQPVFDTIVQSAVRLCAGLFGALFQFDGELLHMVAHHNYTPEALEAAHRVYPARPSRDHGSVRAIVERAVVHIPDVELDPEHQHPGLRRAIGQRSGLFVPILREGDPIGVIMVARPEPGPFSNNEIELLKTFADQAVIAIENVRLFKELEARTRELTRSVGELRALGEIGQAISSTLDLKAVLNTIVARATELSGTDAGVVYEYDEQREVFVPRATEHLETEIVETMLATPVRKGEGATGRLAEVQEPIQMPDILASPAESRVRGALVRSGYRALLAVPLVREGHLLGALTVIRKATGEFAPEVIDLMRTFATQSALAIQNARLFREIEIKSRELEVASQHKSEFLANMSHELRTPLNAVIGFSEVLSERMFGELNEKQDEYLKDIHASGQHLLSLINDILDLSKIEAGKMDLELSDFDLPMTIDNALMLVRERATRRSIELHTSVDERLGPIQADERKIRQVLLNLLSNAIKFTPEGGRIGVEAKPVDRSIEVSVSDTGVGIAAEDQEAVFEEFRQVGTADKKVEGTGLGLALSRKFIELHGGKIWVKSQIGEGSTFTFTVPVRRGQ